MNDSFPLPLPHPLPLVLSMVLTKRRNDFVAEERRGRGGGEQKHGAWYSIQTDRKEKCHSNEATAHAYRLEVEIYTTYTHTVSLSLQKDHRLNLDSMLFPG